MKNGNTYLIPPSGYWLAADDRMRNKVRIRRLTHAPAVRQEDRCCSSNDTVVQWILDKEKISRMVEMAVLSSSSTTSHHVHGVEDRIGLRFWAKAGDSESDEDGKEDEGMEQEEDSSSVHTMDTEEFIDCSKEHGYTMAELLAEDEVQVSPINKTYRAPFGTTAKRIIEDLAVDKKGRPWSGPLPPPHRSPRRTIGDVIATAKVSSKT
jgi:hypothetical protein